MPRKDKAGRAAYSRVYMRKFREAKRDRARAIAVEVASLVEGASANREHLPPADLQSLNGLTHRAARGVLEVLLNEYGITARRILSKLSQMIDAQRLRAIGNGEVQLQDCHDVQLKGIIFAAKLLQMTGALPPNSESAPGGAITVNILQLNGTTGVPVARLLPAPQRAAVDAASAHDTAGSSAHEARLKREVRYEVPSDGAPPVGAECVSGGKRSGLG